jgi:hypothetical protein
MERCAHDGSEAGEAYHPRRPEQTVLYRVLQDNLETFLARQQQHGRPVPQYVEKC